LRAATASANHIAHRLVHDGETVLDVPPKLSAQVRVFATGNGRKTDPVDAHSVAIAALYSAGLVRVEVDDDLVVMGMLADRVGTRGTTLSPARPTHTPASTLRTSHIPDSPTPTLEPKSSPRLDF
jgi:hypothetical protein